MNLKFPASGFLLFAVGAAVLSFGTLLSAQEAEPADPHEWIIETYSFPSSQLVSGFASAERGELKPPALPAADAPEEEILEFIRLSNSIVAHYLEKQGLALPKGGLVLFDPESLTLGARLPRIAQHSLAFTAESYQAGAPEYINLHPVVMEAPAATLRDIVARAGERADHTALLEELEEAAARGEATLISSSRLESRSGERSKIQQTRDTAAPTHFALGSDGLVEYDSETHPEGTVWEFDTVIGADGETIDLNVKLDYHYAPSLRRTLPLTTRDGLAVSTTVTDSFLAELTSQYTMRNGTTKLLGTWKPAWIPGEDEDPDVLQAAFLTADVVRVLPLPNPILAEFLRERGEQVEAIPEGAPDFEKVSDEVPEGMVVRRFVVPPSFLSSRSAGGGAAADPFADPFGGEPTFTIRATVKDILLAVGIPFPDGSSANYLPATSTLVIRNTPENMNLVEAYIMSIRSGVEMAVVATVHVVEGPGEQLQELARTTRSLPDHSLQWEELHGREEFSILSTNRLEGRSGQRSKIVAGRMAAFPSSAFRETTGGKRVGQDESDGKRGSGSISGDISWERIGTTVEVDPVIGADSHTVDIAFSVRYDYAPPVSSGGTLREGEAIHMDGPTTAFHYATVTTSATFRSGMMRLVGMWQPQGTAEFDGADLIQAAFLRVEVVPVVEMETE